MTERKRSGRKIALGVAIALALLMIMYWSAAQYGLAPAKMEIPSSKSEPIQARPPEHAPASTPPTEQSGSRPPSAQRPVDSARTRNRARIVREKFEIPPPPPPPPPAKQGSSGSPRPSDGKASDASLRWNVWAEEDTGALSIQPVTALETGRDYQLVVDLASLALNSGELSRKVEPRLAKALESTTGPINLRILAVPDVTYFRLAADTTHAQTLRATGDAVRRALAALPPANPAAELRANPKADFLVGRVRFPFRAIKAGTGAIALSVWKGDVPVDELSVRFCVAPGDAATCSMHDGVVSTLRSGAELMRPSGELLRGTERAAALHFVELDSDRSAGVFRMNDWEEGRFETWQIDNVVQRLRRFLDESFLTNFSTAGAAARLLTGTELYNLLVPGERERGIVEQGLNELARGQTTPQVLWVRLLASNPRLPYAVPLGMMAVPIAGNPEFLGHRFRIETPLPVMDYRPLAGCISSWMLGVPKGEPEARTDFEPALKAVKLWTGECPGAGCLDTMDALRAWMGDRRSETTPRALFLLAHHSSRGLYFSEGSVISEEGIARRFDAPSVAIFSACNVATPSAYHFAEKMAAQGMAAIVAPATTVPAELGGDYFAQLLSNLSTHGSEPDYTLSHAHWAAVGELREKWGGLALTYLLLGNGGLRLCAPVRAQ